MASILAFQLPDGKTSVSIDAARTAKNAEPNASVNGMSNGHTNGDVPSRDCLTYEVLVNGKHVATWTANNADTTRVDLPMVQDDRAQVDYVRRLELPSHGAIDLGEANSESSLAHTLKTVWTSIYALWLQLHTLDVIPIVVPHGSQILEYLKCSGLAAPSSFDPDVLLLAREAFWQGAGAPSELDWLRVRPEAAFPGMNTRLGVFASQLSFTRKGNVCTTHPLRPPKPAPGTILYSRYIAELGQLLQIAHIDASDALHFENYARWQNSDRVNHGWRERGPDSKHAAYLESQRQDLHTMSCIFSWDGEPAGYCEVGWAKEDNTACFISSNCNIRIDEFDQNSHMLVGEEKFRGGKRYQAVATSIKHLCFLRDPRTQQVIAEPRYDLPSVPIQTRFLPQERKKRFQLPHKQAVLFALQRDRFFQEAHLY